MASYPKKFVPGFASKAAPLNKMLQGHKTSKVHVGKKKGTEYVKSTATICAKALEDLKCKLQSTHILAFPDFTPPSILEIDASM